MKKLLLAFSCLVTGFITEAQNFCNTNGNLIIYSNYDGGVLNINIDENIPNIKIGIVSYEAIEINITGTYAANVTAVHYAGYNDPNDGCGQGVTTTVINSTGSTNTIAIAPPATLANQYGYGSIICAAYSCDNGVNQGGCNTADQIEDYFLTYFSGSVLRSHMLQYNCFATTQNISDGGSCCAGVVPPLGLSIDQVAPTCNSGCNGSLTAEGIGGTGPYTYQWTGGPATDVWSGLCAGTYTVTVTDDLGATATETVTLTEPAAIDTVLYDTACQTYTWASNGMTYTTSGTYLDTVAGTNGCDSFLTLELTIGAGVNVAVTQTSTTFTATQTGATYQWIECPAFTSVSGATAQSYSPGNNNTYAVIVTYQGCSDTSACYSLLPINVEHVAVTSEFNIYPNPAHNEVFIESAITEGEYIITDQLGKEVLRGSLTGNRTAISISGLAQGLYFMKVNDTQPVKLLKQ